MNSLLLAGALLALVVGALLWLASRRLKRASGLPAGRVIYADTGAWQRNERSLYSKRHRLAGKPDYLVQSGRDIIPVEVKSGPAPEQPHEGHLLQLAAYCLLVAENLGQRPPYGIIQYAGRQFAVEYTPELERRLALALEDMRRAAGSPAGARRNHDWAPRCSGCGVREACDERLD